MDNQITKKLLIIKSFLNIYLLDNYYFRDPIIKKKGMNFLEYELKAGLGAIPDSKIQKKKKSPNRTKIGRGAQHPRGPINTLGVPIGTSRLGPGTF